MATSIARFLGSTSFSGEHTAGERIYYRSSSAAHTILYLDIFGTNTSDVVAQEDTTTGDPSGLVEVITTASFNSITLARLWSGDAAGTFTIYSNDGTAATGVVHFHDTISDGDTITVGITGKTQAVTFKTTVASPNQVKIGATLSETADNFASYINDVSTGTSTPVDNTDWSASAANPLLSATVSGTDVTLTDKIKCERALAWVITPSDPTSISVYPMTGGIDGTLIGTWATPAAGDLIGAASTGLGLSSPDQTTKTLPASIVGPASSVPVRGKFSLNIRLGSAPNAQVAAKIQLSNDGDNWWDAPTTTITDLDSDQDQFLSGADLFAEYARLNITTNSATNTTEADIVFVHQS